MPDIPRLIVFTILCALTVWRFPSALRSIEHRSMWFSFAILTLQSFLDWPAVAAQVDQAVGLPTAHLLRRLCIFGACVAVLTWISYISTASTANPEAGRRARNRRNYVVYAVAAVALIVFWALQGKNNVLDIADLRGRQDAARGLFATYELALSYTMGVLVLTARRYRKRTHPSAFRTGITLLGVGGAVAIISSLYNLSHILLTAISPERFDGTFSRPVVEAIIFVAFLIIFAGVSVTAVAVVLQRLRYRKALLVMEPLWNDLVELFPAIHLPNDDLPLPARVDRRVTEIRDGLDRLAACEPATTLDKARTAVAQAGLSGLHADDVAEACWIAAALRTAREGQGIDVQPLDQVQLRGEATTPKEAALLAAITTEYVSSPVVAGFMLTSASEH